MANTKNPSQQTTITRYLRSAGPANVIEISNTNTQKGTKQAGKAKKKEQRKERRKKCRNVDAHSNNMNTACEMDNDLETVMNTSLSELLASQTPMPSPSHEWNVSYNSDVDTAAENPEPALPDNLVQQLVCVSVDLERVKSDNLALNNEIQLLRSVIDENKKKMANLTAELKKSKLATDTAMKGKTKVMEELKSLRRLHDLTTVGTNLSSQKSPQQIDTSLRDELRMAEGKLASLKESLQKVASDLLDVATETQNSGLSWSDVVRGRNRQEQHLPIRSTLMQANQSQESSMVRPPTRQRRPESQRPPTQHPADRQARPELQTTKPKPKVIIIGTSMVRDTGIIANRQGTDACSYTYPGTTLPFIKDRIKHVLPKTPVDHIALMAGGNDLEHYNVAQVILEHDKLVREVQKYAPTSKITLCAVAPRGIQNGLLQKIAKFNSYLKTRGLRKDNVSFVDCAPKSPNMYKSDMTHFNTNGKQVFVRNLCAHFTRDRLRRPV